MWGISHSDSRPSCSVTCFFYQIHFPLNPEQHLSSPNCYAACGLLRGRQGIFCLPEARAVSAVWCPCHFWGSCSEPCAQTQLWAPSTFPMGAHRVLAPASAPLPSLPQLSLWVIKWGSGSSHSREEQLCLKLSLQNVHTDFIACTCHVWLLLWPPVPAACADECSLFLPSQLIALT